MTACTRPGCSGRYASDGYCDECGHKAPAGVLASISAPAGTSGPAGTTSGWAGSVSGPARAASEPASGRGGTGSGSGSSGASSSVSIPTARAGTVGTRSGLGGPSGSTGSRGGSRGSLGANLVEVPPVPRRDPAGAVLTDPSVPESHRFCPACGEPVGRERDGQPGRTEGFCPRDRTRFSFVPGLQRGELVDGRYEILGCLAHGGLGWIYLARDRNVSDAGADRWVVLKGLINTGDADAMAAAVTERRFLVEVDHPNIVKIHDFAKHADPATGEQVGYIVMEYVGGRSLKDLALAHRDPATGSRAPLPLPRVLAYGLEVLPALGYLHERDLLFCDFKPDNVIHAEEQLKLIDLGAVRRIGDDQSALYGTPGYQAPELAREGPSVASDIYTVGRTLAVLSFDFAGFSTRYADKLPDPAGVPLFAGEESYHRLLLRATDPRPAARFGSAAEMAEHLVGVLREVLSAADGVPRPALSTRFTGEVRTFGTGAEALTGPDVAAGLPVPLVDPTDPSAGMLATLGNQEPAAMIEALKSIRERSVDVALWLVRAHLDAGQLAEARSVLTDIGRKAPGDWRIDWYTGLLALRTRDAAEARTAFSAVWRALPGELAPQLALGAAAELDGDPGAAARRYERVWRTDHGYPSAAFGLARMRTAGDDRAGAVAVLDEVPDTSSRHTAAQVAALRLYLTPVTVAAVLVAAATRLERLRLDAQWHAGLAVEVFLAALRYLGVAVEGPATGSGAREETGTRVLGQGLTERDMRLGLERAYRQLASAQHDTLARYALVDRANAVRPRTMF